MNSPELKVPATNVCPKNHSEAARRNGRHFARYLFAAQYAGGKRILDAACGTGFGTGYLALQAKSVTGLDINECRVEWAKAKFAAANTQFSIHDLHDKIDCSEAFGLITSFETLEHVDDPAKCLANMAEVLETNGVAMISVPNGTKELLAGDRKTYHRRHFSREQFAALLTERFDLVKPHSQVYKKGLRHFFRKLTGQGSHHALGYRFVSGFNENAKTWLAICTGPRKTAISSDG